MTTIECGLARLVAWDERHVEPLVAIANDAAIARYLRDRFPHPYTEDDARAWVLYNQNCAPDRHYAIEVDGVLAGAIGVERMSGERRGTWHMGYWLGRAFHGRGIATAACAALTRELFETTDALRAEAEVYHPNVASMRVLEKCGYVCEGIMRRAVTKGPDVYDAHLYAKVRP